MTLPTRCRLSDAEKDALLLAQAALIERMPASDGTDVWFRATRRRPEVIDAIAPLVLDLARE